jgi:hypothetical protein
MPGGSDEHLGLGVRTQSCSLTATRREWRPAALPLAVWSAASTVQVAHPKIFPPSRLLVDSLSLGLG